MKSSFLNALISALMLLLLTSFFMENAGSVRWNWIAVACVVVFLFQLLLPVWQSGLKKISGPALVLPGIDGSTSKQKLW